MGEWKEYKIKDLGVAITGKTPSSNFPEEFGSDMPFITPTDYKYYGKWADYSDRGLSQKGIEKLQNKVLPPNSVLVTCIGSDMGKVVLNKVPVITNQQINSVIPNQELVAPVFLYYKIVDSYETLRMYSQAGTAVPILNKGDFEEINLTIPSDLSEQKSIASILGSLDDKIDLLHRQNKTLEALAETLFRQWFVEEAEGWEEKGIDEIAEFLNGLACQKFPAKTGEVGLPVIKIKELRTGITDASDIARNDVPEKYLVYDGDMLFSWSGSLDIVIWSGGKGVLNQHLFKVSSTEFPQWFYYFWVKQHLPEFQGIAEDKATTMGHIQRHHLSSAMVLVPPKNQLKEMDEIINPTFEKIKSNQIQIRTLTRLRDTLLPKLMSGEVRVNN